MRSLQSKITHLSIERVRHGECGRYPAVSIDDVRGQALDDARDRVTDVLGGRDQQRTREQQHRGEVVMHAKRHGVRDDLLPLQILAQPSQ